MNLINFIYSKLQKIYDPCLPKHMLDTVTLEDGRHMTVEGTGNWLHCQDASRSLLNQSVTCMKKPCSINGVFQPEIDYYNSAFYGFSEFWYTMEDVMRMGGHYDYNQFSKASKVSIRSTYMISIL